MKKKLLCLVCAILLCFPMIVGCSGAQYLLDYYDEMDDKKGYNRDLFYENDMPVGGADPGCIYISDETDKENYGWFYMYPTADISEIGVGYCAYRSRDLKSWERVGAAFVPQDGSWAVRSLWAPEVIYDKDEHKYYMFFTADNINQTGGLLFESNADKKLYREKEAEVKAMISGLEKLPATRLMLEKLAERREFFEDAVPDVEEVDGITYTQEQITAAIANIDSNALIYVEGTTELSTNEDDVNTNYKRTLATLVKSYVANISFISGSNRSISFGVAVSDKPQGPFVQYTNVEGEEGYNANNRTLTLADTFMAMEDNFYWLKYHKSDYWKGPEGDTNPGQMTATERATTVVDAHPFLDPKSGKKYLYFTNDMTNNPSGFVTVVEMGEKWTDDPKWETMTRLTRGNYYTTDDMSDANKADELNSSFTNDEGAQVYYNKEVDKYYLVCSVSQYALKTYSVIQAVGDSPMGPFRKLKKEEGGILLYAEDMWDHVSGTGHNSFVEYDGQLYIVYHAHYDRANVLPAGSRNRGVCVDPIVFVKNDNGDTVMHVNGPTYSLQPLLGSVAQYKNIATEATVKATNVAKGSDAKYLNDGVIKFYSFNDFINEFESGKKKETKITLKFDDWRTIRALMVYNTFNYEYHWEEIAKVEFVAKKTVNGKEVSATVVIENLAFDVERYINEKYEYEEFMRPGGAAIAEFDEMQVKEIRLTFKHDKPIAISEIYVLGK